MRKILYFGSSKGIGLTYHLTKAAKYFHKLEGIELEVVSGVKEQFPGLFDELTKNNVPYKKIKGIDEIEHFNVSHRKFLNYVKSLSPDIIHTQTNTHFLHSVLAKYRPKSNFKIFHTIHGYHHGAFLESIYMSAITSIVLNMFADKVFVCSTFVKKHFKKFLLNKTYLLPLGYELKEKKAMGKNLSNIKIVYLAKFHKAKGHLWLLKALNPILTANSDVNVVLPGDGETLEKCKRFVYHNNIDSQVEFTGWIDRENIEAVLAEASIAIIPSRTETFGHNIVEPMFFKMPVISTKTGIAPDIIRDGYNGYLVDYRDTGGLRDKINKLINNRARIKEMGNNAFNTVKRKLNWQTIAFEYKEYLEQWL